MIKIIPLAFLLVIFNFFPAASAEKNSSVKPLTDSAPTESVFDIQKYEGKIVYLDFWASWCIPCRKSFPWMNKIQAQYSSDKLVVITINLDKKKELATNFLKEYPANFQVFYDPEGKLAKKYQIRGMPSSILFDATGKPVAAHKGFFSRSIPKYEAEIKDLIQTTNI